jgi:biopolymer transport protein ExbB/TolQ
VIKAGLTRANKGKDEIENAVDEEVLRLTPLITKRLTWLPGLASLATMLGLLGTIIGMIEAFEAVAHAAPDQKQTALANAIAIAMNTTAFGLIVAIPTLFIAMMLSTLVKKILDEIEEYSLRIVNMLVLRGQGGTDPLNR